MARVRAANLHFRGAGSMRAILRPKGVTAGTLSPVRRSAPACFPARVHPAALTKARASTPRPGVSAHFAGHADANFQSNASIYYGSRRSTF